MASPITTTATPTITTTSDVSSQTQNSSLSTESTISSTENHGCCQKITNFFSNILQWLKDHLCCCFFQKSPEEPTTSTEATTESTAADPAKLVQANALRAQINELINNTWEPILPQAEKNDIINWQYGPHHGKTKEQAWNERKAEWNANIKKAGLSLVAALDFLQANNFIKSKDELVNFFDNDAIFNEFHEFVDANLNDLQAEPVREKMVTLIEAFPNLCII